MADADADATGQGESGRGMTGNLVTTHGRQPLQNSFLVRLNQFYN
jgi:hypothetical protein